MKTMTNNFVHRFLQGKWISRAHRLIRSNAKLSALAMETFYYIRRKRSFRAVKMDLALFCNYVTDIARGRYRGFKLSNLLIIVAVLIYVCTPFDIIPDFLPGGFIDDVSIIGWATKKFAEEISLYRKSSLCRTPQSHSAENNAAPQTAVQSVLTSE